MDKVYKFEWGQVVRVSDSAPAYQCPGQVASICGIRSCEEHHLYLVEFASGKSLEVNESLLTRADDESSNEDDH